MEDLHCGWFGLACKIFWLNSNTGSRYLFLCRGCTSNMCMCNCTCNGKSWLFPCKLQEKGQWHQTTEEELLITTYILPVQGMCTYLERVPVRIQSLRLVEIMHHTGFCLSLTRAILSESLQLLLPTVHRSRFQIFVPRHCVRLEVGCSKGWKVNSRVWMGVAYCSYMYICGCSLSRNMAMKLNNCTGVMFMHVVAIYKENK